MTDIPACSPNLLDDGRPPIQFPNQLFVILAREMFGLDEDGTRPRTRQPIPLPEELRIILAKYLDDRDCVALALSGAFEDYASLYVAER